MSRDIRSLLDTLGIPHQSITDPNDGYDGTYEPEQGGCFLHWTGGPSDTAASVVAANHYHYCAGRDGVIYVGGWNVKQGHGGEGRQAPLNIARSSLMTLDDLDHWQCNNAGDDTDSWPNRYFTAVAIDNDGVGEKPTDVQWYAFTGCAAAILVGLGKDTRSLIDHASSTNRKIDVATSPAMPLATWHSDIGYCVDLLTNGPDTMSNDCVSMDVHPSGKGYAQLTEKGYVYVNAEPGSGVRYYGGVSDTDVIAAGHRATSIRWTKDGGGYYITTSDGNCFTVGSAVWYGAAAPDMVA